MIITKYTFRRPNITVPYFPLPASVVSHMNENYVSTGDCTGISFIFVDGVTLEGTNSWVSTEARDRFLADPVIEEFNNQRRAYNSINGITEELTITAVN